MRSSIFVLLLVLASSLVCTADTAVGRIATDKGSYRIKDAVCRYGDPGFQLKLHLYSRVLTPEERKKARRGKQSGLPLIATAKMRAEKRKGGSVRVTGYKSLSFPNKSYPAVALSLGTKRCSIGKDGKARAKFKGKSTGIVWDIQCVTKLWINEVDPGGITGVIDNGPNAITVYTNFSMDGKGGIGFGMSKNRHTRSCSIRREAIKPLIAALKARSDYTDMKKKNNIKVISVYNKGGDYYVALHWRGEGNSKMRRSKKLSKSDSDRLAEILIQAGKKVRWLK